LVLTCPGSNGSIMPFSDSRRIHLSDLILTTYPKFIDTKNEEIVSDYVAAGED
jgi:hypothetical protein